MTCSCHPDVATQARADAQRDIHRDEACELRKEIRLLRESLAAMARESGEKSETIRWLEKQLAEARRGDFAHD